MIVVVVATVSSSLMFRFLFVADVIMLLSFSVCSNVRHGVGSAREDNDVVSGTILKKRKIKTICVISSSH